MPALEVTGGEETTAPALPSITAPMQTTSEQFEQAGLTAPTGATEDTPIASGFAAPVDAPTVQTSDDARETVAKDQSELTNIKEQQEVTQEQTQQQEAPPVDTPTALDSRIDQERDDTDPFAGLADEINQHHASMDAEAEAQMNMLDEMKSRFDATAQKKISAISAAFARRRAQQKMITANRVAGLGVMGIRSGRTRFAAEIQSGIISAEERAGIQKLADLDAQEQGLIADAMDANDEKNFTLLRDKMQLMRQTRKDKLDVASQLQNLAMDKENLLMKRAQAEREELQFEREAQDRELEDMAFGLMGASDADILAQAEQMGLPAGKLLSMTKQLKRQDRLGELDVRKAELDVQKAGLAVQKASQAVSNSDSPSVSTAETWLTENQNLTIEQKKAGLLKMKANGEIDLDVSTINALAGASEQFLADEDLDYEDTARTIVKDAAEFGLDNDEEFEKVFDRIQSGELEDEAGDPIYLTVDQQEQLILEVLDQYPKSTRTKLQRILPFGK